VTDPVLSPDGRYQWLNGQWQSTSPAPSSDGKAIASLVLSILWLAGFGSIAGVILGHLSRGEAKRAGRAPSGMALAGLIIGYVGAALFLIGILAAIAIPVFLNERMKDEDAQARGQLRAVALLEESYYTDASTYTSDLSALPRYEPRADVDLRILSASESGYCLSAVPRHSDRTFYYLSGVGVSTEPCT
jgi:Tfp pilus assembly protein PilE